jgi:large subunit ribosomal protein L22
MAEVKAKSSHLFISPVKLRLVIDKVRGLNVQQALTVLSFMPQKGAKFVYKTVDSAASNAQNNFDINPDTLYISEIYAGEGPRLRRYKAGARGRYKPRVKRTSHLWVVLAEREG